MDGLFFEKVLFGGSHQGSMINLLKGDADVAAFMNMPQYFDVIQGEENKAGVIYEVKKMLKLLLTQCKGNKHKSFFPYRS